MTTVRDETTELELQFDDKGLIPAIVSEVGSGLILMFAYINRAAFELCQATGQLHLYSRSRQKIWKKGESSGETFQIVRILTDCDQDVLQIEVSPQGQGAACHTGRKTCFYRAIEGDRLVFNEQQERLFDPAVIYRK